MILLAINWVSYPEGSERWQLQNVAAESWSRIQQENPQVRFLAIGEKSDAQMAPDFMEKPAFLYRSATTVFGYNKSLPFLRDILTRLLEYSAPEPENWYGYLNSDIIMKPEMPRRVHELENEGFTSIICRADEIPIVDDYEQALTADNFTLEFSGRDLYMFKRGGGNKLLEQLQDYLIGEPAWDLDAYRILMKDTKMHDDIDSSALTIHMNHDRTWRSNSSLGKQYNEMLYCLKYRLAQVNQDGFYSKHLNR